jgi:ArsR family transcriptional regulator, arsenate/arsenite/antimonite-responsive transcriptional repressor
MMRALKIARRRSVTRTAAAAPAVLGALPLATPGAMARQLPEPPIDASTERDGSASEAPGAPVEYADVGRGQAERMATIASALSDPVRLQLVDVLRSHADKVCMCELMPLFDISRSTLSHHLKVLCDAGLVDSERRGLWTYYHLIPDALPVSPRSTDENVDWDSAGIGGAAVGGLVLVALAGFATARRARILTPKEETSRED